MSQNLLQWTVADVASYFSAAGFPEQAVAFRTQVSAAVQSCYREHCSYIRVKPNILHHFMDFVLMYYFFRGSVIYTMSLLHCSKLKNGAVGLNTQSISLETQA